MDGDVDFDDIDDFVLALGDPAAYELAFGVPPETTGDIDGDGDVDFDDIPGFVDALTGGSISALPASTGPIQSASIATMLGPDMTVQSDEPEVRADHAVTEDSNSVEMAEKGMVRRIRSGRRVIQRDFVSPAVDRAERSEADRAWSERVDHLLELRWNEFG
jgi:hypothetical protein